MEYELSVGLEVHAELNTKTKIFCGCENRFGAPPNTLVCPVCMGLPGALPVLSEAVLEQAVRMGHALHCDINRVCRLDRKQYFYPDLPKAYQISQDEIPLCSEGFLELTGEGKPVRVRIERIHIEEDAGKLVHAPEGGTLVDYNRCGVPLIEIVTAPDLHAPEQVGWFLEEIRSILRCLGVSDCRMEEGSMRCDVNVSLRPACAAALGARCELKNVATISGAVRAVQCEAARQREILQSGGVIERETRRWDDAENKSLPMRSKEETADYRFFPEPDLGTVVLPEEQVRALLETLPELPADRRRRLCTQYGITPYAAVQLTADPARAGYFEQGMAAGLCTGKELANWILGDLLAMRGLEPGDRFIEPERLAALAALAERGEISRTAGKTLLAALPSSGLAPGELARKMGLLQENDSAALATIAEKVLWENPAPVADYRAGKTKALGFLVGKCMAASGGRGNPAVLRRILTEKLDA